MKNKIIMMLLFASTFIFIGTSRVYASECLGPNLTSGIKNKANEKMPDLCINGGYGYNVASYYYTFLKKHDTNDYKYIIVQNNDATNIYKYYAYIIADYGYYNSGTTYRYAGSWYARDDAYYSNAVYMSSDLSYISFTAQASSYPEKWAYYYGPTLADVENKVNVCNTNTCAPTTYSNVKNRGMIFKLRYNTTTSSWETFADYNNNQYTYNNGSTPSILYSSLDIWTDITSGTIYHGSDYSPAPNVEGFAQLDVSDKYGAIFKLKNETSTSEIMYNFYTFSSLGFTMNWLLSTPLTNSQVFLKSIEIKNYYENWGALNIADYSTEYTLNSLHRLQFILKVSDDTSTGGSSGGGHSGGDGRHDFGEDPTYSGLYSYIYYDATIYDYCILDTETSECKFTDNSIENNTYHESYQSFSDVMEDLNKFIKSQSKYFTVFGNLFSQAFTGIEHNLQLLVISIFVIVLIIAFIGMVRRK